MSILHSLPALKVTTLLGEITLILYHIVPLIVISFIYYIIWSTHNIYY